MNINPAETVRADRPERRTGVVFLGLIVATNFIPWMQLTEGGSDTSLASAAESAFVLATCMFAAAGVVTCWLLGRKLPEGWGPRVRRPRDTGLLLVILVAAANLALAAVLKGRVARAAVPFSHELRWFGPVWGLLVVPTQFAAAFCKGRASLPFSAAPRLSGSTGSGTGEPLSSL